MTATEGKVQEARASQRKASKRATINRLLSKKRNEVEFSIYLAGPKGEQEELTLKFRSIGATEYDALVAEHPPTKDQTLQGASFNIDTFAPALISKCSVEPEISPDEAKELWASPDWSRGDLLTLWQRAVEVNTAGLDVPFSARG